MRILFSVFLVLNLLAELLAATSLIGGPDGIAAAGRGNQWAMHYGFAVLAIASATLWVWPQRSHLKVVTAVLGVLMVFHSGVLASLVLAGDQPVGVVIHSVLALLAIGLFTQRARWCTVVE
jgi:hypothetical protein